MSIANRAISKLRLTYQGSSFYLWSMYICSRSERLADLWYFVTGAFRREHRAVLAGCYKHHLELRTTGATAATYMLRRNAHRLEKGLIMRPRRERFAEDYIEETVEAYERIFACVEKPTDPDLKSFLHWTTDVLKGYFAAVKDSPRIANARQRFDKLTDIATEVSVIERDVSRPGAGGKMAPYKRDLDQPSQVSIDDLEQLAIRRRSCRWFRPERVPREVIDRAVRVAGYSPSACNRQPFQFLVYDDPETTRQVGDIPMGTRGFADNFPGVVVVVGHLDAFPHYRDRHVPYIDASLAAMALLFAFETQNVGTCCINWPDLKKQEREIAKIVGLPPEQRVIMLIAFGYPDREGQVPYSEKKPVAQLRTYNVD